MGDRGDDGGNWKDWFSKPKALPKDLGIKVFKEGPARRVIFYYPGEEGTYIDDIYVTLFENGIVHLHTQDEETTTHLRNCEILWRCDNEMGERSSKLRLLREPGKSPELL